MRRSFFFMFLYEGRDLFATTQAITNRRSNSRIISNCKLYKKLIETSSF